MQVVADRVLVKEKIKEQKTASGIIIPDMVKTAISEGEVISAGWGLGDEKMVVKKGDTVMYGRSSGTKITLDGEEYLIMRQYDLLIIL